MSDTNTVIPASPAHPAGTGSTKKGGHHIAFVNCPRFPVEASLQLTSTICPWHTYTPGYKLWSEVLQTATTVQQAIDLGAVVLGPFKSPKAAATAIQGHLRWLYTWGNYIAIGGVQYPNHPGSVVAPAPLLSEANPSEVAAALSEASDPVPSEPVAPKGKRSRKGLFTKKSD